MKFDLLGAVDAVIANAIKTALMRRKIFIEWLLLVQLLVGLH